MYRTSPPRGRTYTQGPAQASACTCAHARTHRRSRRAQRPAPHRSPAERVRHSARRRAGSGAYTGQRGDGRGVPRADVGVERRRRGERLRAEATTRSTPTGKGSHGLGFRDSGRARSTSPPTRAHTADPSPCTLTGVYIFRTESNAYPVQRGDGRGVPRADVRVERRRGTERLRAEPPAVNRRREGARTCRRGCVRAQVWHTRTHARARKQHVGAFEAEQPHARPYPSLTQVQNNYT